MRNVLYSKNHERNSFGLSFYDVNRDGEDTTRILFQYSRFSIFSCNYAKEFTVKNVMVKGSPCSTEAASNIAAIFEMSME